MKDRGSSDFFLEEDSSITIKFSDDSMSALGTFREDIARLQDYFEQIISTLTQFTSGGGSLALNESGAYVPVGGVTYNASPTWQEEESVRIRQEQKDSDDEKKRQTDEQIKTTKELTEAIKEVASQKTFDEVQSSIQSDIKRLDADALAAILRVHGEELGSGQKQMQEMMDRLRSGNPEDYKLLLTQAADRGILSAGIGSDFGPSIEISPGQQLDMNNMDHLRRIVIGLYNSSQTQSAGGEAAASALGGGFTADTVAAAAEQWGLGDFQKTGRLGAVDWKQMLFQGLSKADALGAAAGTATAGTAATAGAAAGGGLVATASAALSAIGGPVAIAMIAKQLFDVGMDEYTKMRNAGSLTGESGAAAFGRGIEMETQARMMAISPFINTEQAKKIVNSVYAEGFTGQTADNVLDFASENFSKFNMDVADSIRLYQVGVKEGSMSIGELNAAIESMRDIASDTQMSIGDITDAFIRMAKKFKAGLGMEEDEVTDMVAAVAAVSEFSGVSEDYAQGVYETGSDFYAPMYQFLQASGMYSPSEIADIKTDPARIVEVTDEYILYLMQMYHPWVMDMAAQSESVEDFRLLMQPVWGVWQLGVVPHISSMTKGQVADQPDEFLKFFWSAYNKVGGKAAREAVHERTTPRAFGKDDASALAGDVAFGGFQTRLGVLQRGTKVVTGAWDVLTKDDFTIEDMRKRVEEGTYADQRHSAKMAIAYSRSFGENLSRDEAAKMEAEILENRNALSTLPRQIEIVVQVLGEGRKWLSAMVLDEAMTKGRGEGTMSTNER